MPNNRLPKICYKLQLKWLDANLFTKCWVKDIRDLLLVNGFGYAWYDQRVGNEKVMLRLFEQKLQFIDISPCFPELADICRLRTCRILKDSFCYETYLYDTLIIMYT